MTVALAVAGTVNVVILLLAASTLPGVDGAGTLPGAHAAISAALGPVVATLFAATAQAQTPRRDIVPAPIEMSMPYRR